MDIFTLARYLHFVSIIGISGTLIASLIVLKSQMSKGELKQLSKIDGLYGLSAIVAVAAGLAMWLWVGKPASFYSENPVFLVKLGLVISLGLLSIYPTVFFTRNKSKREGDSQDIVHIPNGVIWSVRIELLLLFSIPLLAILMARGISSF